MSSVENTLIIINGMLMLLITFVIVGDIATLNEKDGERDNA